MSRIQTLFLALIGIVMHTEMTSNVSGDNTEDLRIHGEGTINQNVNHDASEASRNKRALENELNITSVNTNNAIVANNDTYNDYKVVRIYKWLLDKLISVKSMGQRIFGLFVVPFVPMPNILCKCIPDRTNTSTDDSKSSNTTNGGDDFKRPISFDRIPPNTPISRTPPPVDRTVTEENKPPSLPNTDEQVDPVPNNDVRNTGEEFRRPISFDPIPPNIPINRKPPPVDHTITEENKPPSLPNTDEQVDPVPNNDVRNSGEEFRRPISFDPIPPSIPTNRKPPPVDHGSVQHDINSSQS